MYEQEIAGHRKNETGFGSSKSQHFINHAREVEVGVGEWRDKQEEWIEAAQLAACEELTCSVCRNDCITRTKYMWDKNRELHSLSPKYPEYEQMSVLMCTHACSNKNMDNAIKLVDEAKMEMR